jgi:hypothetical protein
MKDVYIRIEALSWHAKIATILFLYFSHFLRIGIHKQSLGSPPSFKEYVYIKQLY